MNTRRARFPLLAVLGACAVPLAFFAARERRPLPPFQTLPARFDGAPRALDWSRDGQHIVGAGPVRDDDGKRRIALRWWTRRGDAFKVARTIVLLRGESIDSLQFVPGASGAAPQVLSVGAGVAQKWNLAAGRVDKRLAPTTRDMWGVNRLVLAARLSPDGRTLACGEAVPVLTGTSRGRVTARGWNGAVQVLGGGKMGPVRELAWSDDSSLLAAGSQNGDVSVYEMPSGRVVRKWKATPKHGNASVTFEDGRRDVTTLHAEVRGVAFAPSSDVLLVSGGGKVAAREARSGRPVPVPPIGDGAMRVSPRGLLASAQGSDIEVRDLSGMGRQSFDDLDRAPLALGRTITLPHGGSGLAFSPDERQMLACGWDGRVVL